uniref:DUF4604 domain-containing protein n=1 Tax=Syphacia muris TaxID=451379 RepID=A0A0N5AY06_9BILA
MTSSRKLTYKEKSSIHFVESAEPKFIRKLKEQVGYKQVTIEDKVTYFLLFQLEYCTKKIIFKKPQKRVNEDTEEAPKNEKKHKSNEEKINKANSRLLSFGDEEDESY